MTRGSLKQWSGVGVTMIALAAVLWSTYHGVERLVPSWRSVSEHSSPSDGEPAAGAGLEQGFRFDISDIVQAHLFGTAAETAPDTEVEAPETKLQLDLMGLVASADDRLARAIIRVDGARVQPYAVGDSINGTDAAVHAVESRRVLLNRGGALESLLLKRESALDSSSVSVNTDGYGPIPENTDADSGEDLQAPGFGEEVTGDRMKLPF